METVLAAKIMQGDSVYLDSSGQCPTIAMTFGEAPSSGFSRLLATNVDLPKGVLDVASSTVSWSEHSHSSIPGLKVISRVVTVVAKV